MKTEKSIESLLADVSSEAKKQNIRVKRMASLVGFLAIFLIACTVTACSDFRPHPEVSVFPETTEDESIDTFQSNVEIQYVMDGASFEYTEN